MSNQQHLSDSQIQDVFVQLGLSGNSLPSTPHLQSVPPPPPSQPIYFPLSADSLAVKNPQ